MGGSRGKFSIVLLGATAAARSVEGTSESAGTGEGAFCGLGKALDRRGLLDL